MASPHGPEIDGLDKLNAWFRARAAKLAHDNPIVAVGYTASYALYVHENTEMKLKGLPRGQGFGRDSESGAVVVPPALLKTGKAGGKNRGFYWDPQGKAQPKFLETPLREKRDLLARIVVTALGQGKTMAQALLLAGLRLQRESMMLVPVDTGNLKASAFTRLEHGEVGMETMTDVPTEGVE